MSIFRGRSFIYNDVMSDMFGLEIISFETGGITSIASSEREVVESYLPRRYRSVLYGINHTEPLVFRLVAGSCRPLSAEMQMAINRWLIGQRAYAPLRIVQDDMESVYYNALITNLEYTSFGNYAFAISATVHCDSPYAWTLDEVIERTYAPSISPKGIDIYNSSDVLGFVYPDVIIKADTSLSQFVGVGNTASGDTGDANRFMVTELAAGRITTINVRGENRILTCDSPGFKLSQFNKRWIRLAPGMNHLVLHGAQTYIKITFRTPKIIGG